MKDPPPSEFITRKKWGAKNPKSTEALITPVKLLVLKYGTNTDSCKTKEECIKMVQELQRRHMDEKGMPDIGYNFLVGEDGNIYEGRGWKTKTAPYTQKDKRYEDLNSRSIDVVFIGRWVEKPPLADMMSAVADLCVSGIEKGYLHEDMEVFGPSQLKKPIIKHNETINVQSKKEEMMGIDMDKFTL